MDKYWNAKDKFAKQFRDIRNISGLSIDTIANDNMVSPLKIKKVENGVATFNHDEFVMLVWYMARVPSIKNIILEFESVIKEYRQIVIPDKYAIIYTNKSHYYKQGHMPVKYIRLLAGGYY